MESKRYIEGDLVWAKMRGFPMWPAKIIDPHQNGKYCVLFYGTRETSFLKACDLADYLPNEHIYGRHKTNKPEFRQALEEIRKDAGLPDLPQEPDIKVEDDLMAPIDVNMPCSSYGRTRKPSVRLADNNFVAPNTIPRRRNNSNSYNLDLTFDRIRNDSTSSLFGKRTKIPSIGDIGDFDVTTAENMLQGDLGLSGLDSDGSNNMRHVRRRRRTTSKLLDDVLTAAARDRNFSISSDIKSHMTDANNLFEMLDSVGANMDLQEFYTAIDQLPSEESDRPQTPENISPMPKQIHRCSRCNTQQRYVGFEWKCPNNCGDYSQEYKLENMEDLESYFDDGTNPFSFKKETKKVQFNTNITPKKSSSNGKLKRPRSYKVEKTPPVQSNGVRLCVFCNGHVRPQMCGGNKHRWRCVDKKCRKWYGWVRSNEEIPKDLGKKGRWKDLKLKVQGHTEDGQLVQMIPDRSDSPEEPPPKPKKKKKPDPPRPLTPMTEEQIAYVPTPLEQKVRWWRTDRKRVEPSPEKELPCPTYLDITAAMRLCKQTAENLEAFTHSLQGPIDPGSASGFVDLMMDLALTSIGPIISIAANAIPNVHKEDPNLAKRLFESTIEHLPFPQ